MNTVPGRLGILQLTKIDLEEIPETNQVNVLHVHHLIQDLETADHQLVVADQEAADKVLVVHLRVEAEDLVVVDKKIWGHYDLLVVSCSTATESSKAMGAELRCKSQQSFRPGTLGPPRQ